MFRRSRNQDPDPDENPNQTPSGSAQMISAFCRAAGKLSKIPNTGGHGNPQRGLRENNNKKLTQKFGSACAETSAFWQWRFFSAHRRAADSAICLAVAIFLLELVAPSLERASGMVAVLESKTHGSDCLIVLIAFITFIHEAVCVNPRGRMYDLRRARRGRKKGCSRGNVRIDCASCEPSVR